MLFRSLEAYARRWLKLTNHELVRDENPYFVPYDQLAEQYKARGQTLVSFSHYDYLGLSGHPEVRAAACRAITETGTGAGASRLVGGERAAHRAFETDLADFLGVGDALALVSGYGTNVSILGHILGKRDLIVADQLSHNSIIAGAKMSRADTLFFRHNDPDELEHLLRTRRAEHGRVLIVIEGLYSMDGDIPDLERILALRDAYDAWLMVDEAHSFGVLGERGRGVSEYFNVDPDRIDFLIGTLSKALVSCGGFIGARRIVIEWMRYTLPGFVYSVGLAPPILASAHAALKIMRAEYGRVAKMRENSRYLLERARAMGLSTVDAIGAGVVPILFETVEQTDRKSTRLNSSHIPLSRMPSSA